MFKSGRGLEITIPASACGPQTHLRCKTCARDPLEFRRILSFTAVNQRASGTRPCVVCRLRLVMDSSGALWESQACILIPIAEPQPPGMRIMEGTSCFHLSVLYCAPEAVSLWFPLAQDDAGQEGKEMRAMWVSVRPGLEAQNICPADSAKRSTRVLGPLA